MTMGEGSSRWDWESRWPAPAKLNLFLHVTGRRPDGYHLLQTVFCLIDRTDTLRFQPRSDDQIVLATPLPGVPPESDLTVRAARLLQAETGCTQGATMTLEKNLPMGGGLGGGSSDAATVLLALNHLWQLGLSRPRLQALGLTLGADVPVFIHGQNVFAEGIGEDFTPVSLPPTHYLVAEPPVQVPTPVIFSAPELRRDTPAMRPADWRPGMGGNDLQAVAAARFPEVAACLKNLSRLGEARMTGSGACVFVPFSSAEAAQAALRQIPDGLRAWVASGLTAHPLAQI